MHMGTSALPDMYVSSPYPAAKALVAVITVKDRHLESYCTVS